MSWKKYVYLMKYFRDVEDFANIMFLLIIDYAHINFLYIYL